MNKTVSAEEARALREGRESFGAWDAGAGNIYAGHDTCPRHKAPGDGGDLTARCECRAIGAVDRDGDRNLAAAAPDLAATVEALVKVAENLLKRAEAAEKELAAATEKLTRRLEADFDPLSWGDVGWSSDRPDVVTLSLRAKDGSERRANIPTAKVQTIVATAKLGDRESERRAAWKRQRP